MTITTKTTTVANRMRASADGLNTRIDELRNSATSQQRPTPKRLRTMEAMAQKADRLERIQCALYALADARDSGTLPDALVHVTDRQTIEILLYREEYPALQAEATRIQRARIGPSAYVATRAAFMNLIVFPERNPSGVRIQLLEKQVLLDRIPGFFTTPVDVCRRLLEWAAIQPGMSVLEPSAGRGDMVDVLCSTHPDCNVVVIECHHTLREILTLKGYQLVGSDFLDHTGSYDRILMNPPFERGQDMAHVQHAYACLNPGGRLVAIMSCGKGPRPSSYNEFRTWFTSVNGCEEELAAGAFRVSDRATGVRAKLVVINKPLVAPTA